jgi:hypothetical protein
MKELLRIVLLLLLLCCDDAGVLFRAAFGSCNHQDLEVYASPVMDAIAKEDGKEWWWLGDIG